MAFAPGGPARSFPCWVEVLEQVSPAGARWNLIWNPVSIPGAVAPGGSGRSFPCWVEVLEQVSPSRWANVESNLEPGKCPRGFGARRPPPGASPVGSKSSSKCLPPAGSTWNLTVPGALAPGGSGRRSSQREG